MSNTDIARSLAITDPEILAAFPLRAVLERLETSANVAETETPTTIVQRWFRTFGSTPQPGDCNDANVDPNDYGLACPRAAEASLATVDPFAASAPIAWTPVALFNRFDLAPADGAHCGEHRIVYAMSSDPPNRRGRGFIIFEAALPNPTPGDGIAGCLPVARFWQGLSADGNSNSRKAKLEQFYLSGGAVDGFAPVIRAQHLGLGSGRGQVRTNMFVDNATWHLREFKLARDCADANDRATCTLAFRHVTVKQNPAEELFAGTHTRSGAFRTSFGPQVAGLAANALTGIGMNIGDEFNEFESVSQAANVEYASSAGADIRATIQTQLTTLGSSLTVDNILDRATTQTCAGCHQRSSTRALGGGLTWPATAGGFVHVTETRALSPALTETFLPHRKQVLERFINTQCGDGGTPESGRRGSGRTIGGSVVGAHN